MMKISTDKKIDVLVIDDSSMTLKLYAKMLESYHLAIHYEHDPTEAIELIKKKIPRLILTDYMMPIMDGKDFAIKFSELKLFKHCSLCLITAKELTENDKFSMMSLGYEYIIKKPVSHDKFYEILKSYFPELDQKTA